MRKISHIFIALSLLFVIIKPIQISAQQTDESEPQKLTHEEENEAREFAEKFIARYRETQDFKPLVQEMFVSDFATGIKQFLFKAVEDNNDNDFISPELYNQAKPEEIMRGYLTGVGFYHQLIQFYSNSNKLEDEETSTEEIFREFLSPAFFSLIENDKALKKLIPDFLPDELLSDEEKSQNETNQSEENSNENDSTDTPKPKTYLIQNLDELNGLISNIQKLTSLLRDANDRVETAIETKAALENVIIKKDEDENSIDVDLCIRDEEYFGAPPKTRVFEVKFSVFQIDLIKVDNKLKVLTIYPLVD